MSVACGLLHILVLTIDGEMFSWGIAKTRDPNEKDGSGNSGVLGFGEGDETEEIS